MAEPENGRKFGEAVRRVRELIRDARERSRDDHAQIAERLSLGLDFEHYGIKDRGQNPSRILPRDPGLFDIWRYKTALTLKRFPMVVRCRPESDEAGDMAAQSVADVQDAIDDWLQNSRNRFKDTRRRYVGGAYAAGAWGAWLDYDPERKTAVIRPLDDRNLLMPDGIFDPHDPECEWVIVLDRVPTERVRRMKRWKGSANVHPDPGYEMPTTEDSSDLKPGQVNLASGGPDGSDIDPSARTTIAYCYYRTSYKTRPTKSGQQAKPGDERLFCTSCGWTSPPQREMMSDLPMADRCPECGQLAELTDENISTAPKYPKGRMVICAPLDESLVEPFYDDAWPVDWPTFPVMRWTPYVYPHRALPQSDISVHKTGVLASNAIVRLDYEMRLKSRPLMALPQIGTFVNSRRQPWTGKFEDGDILFGTSAGPPPPITFYKGSTPPDNFSLYDRLQTRMRENQGTSQIALDPSRSRDIPVGSLQIQTETGNVPLDDHGAGLYDAEAPLMDCLAATLAFAYVPGRLIRKQDETGQDAFRMVSGLRMPRVSVEVSAGPSLDAIDLNKLNSYRALIGVPEGMPIPPEHLMGAAKFMRVPYEVIQQIQKDRAEAEAKAMQDENTVMQKAHEIVSRRMAQPGAVPPQAMARPAPPMGRMAVPNGVPNA